MTVLTTTPAGPLTSALTHGSRASLDAGALGELYRAAIVPDVEHPVSVTAGADAVRVALAGRIDDGLRAELDRAVVLLDEMTGARHLDDVVVDLGRVESLSPVGERFLGRLRAFAVDHGARLRVDGGRELARA